MPKRLTQREKIVQAIANLKAAIAELTADGADEAAMAPYRRNLQAEEARLRKLP